MISPHQSTKNSNPADVPRVRAFFLRYYARCLNQSPKYRESAQLWYSAVIDVAVDLVLCVIGMLFITAVIVGHSLAGHLRPISPEHLPFVKAGLFVMFFAPFVWLSWYVGRFRGPPPGIEYWGSPTEQRRLRRWSWLLKAPVLCAILLGVIIRFLQSGPVSK
jgi:hypothetical protein